MSRFFGIGSSEAWRSVVPVDKGWSDDEKYLVRGADDRPLLLRLSDIARYEEKKKEFEIIGKYAQTGVNLSAPLEFGVCEQGRSVYMLLGWVEGRDLEEVLPELTEGEQYALGREAGRILRKIHAIPMDPQDVPAETKKPKKLRQLALYEASSVRVPGDETALRYVRENIDRIWREAPVYLHGDFHPGNLICTPEGTIGVIDFNRWEVGDPYEEFYKLESFGREVSVPYCIGQIDAYFRDAVPETFWKTLAVYVAHASLYSVKWAEKFGQEEIDGMLRRCRTAFDDYDDFRRWIPKWYSGKRGSDEGNRDRYAEGAHG